VTIELFIIPLSMFPHVSRDCRLYARRQKMIIFEFTTKIAPKVHQCNSELYIALLTIKKIKKKKNRTGKKFYIRGLDFLFDSLYKYWALKFIPAL